MANKVEKLDKIINCSTCFYCKGKGEREAVYRDFTQMISCQQCDGKGFIIKKSALDILEKMEGEYEDCMEIRCGERQIRDDKTNYNRGWEDAIHFVRCIFQKSGIDVNWGDGN